MNYEVFVGQTLDDKYQIERELGRGGMGTVYLATHLGTERPVALKIIAPEFMERPEFVERFRREAKAAGRLRHPNVVDVTDFGFAQTDQGRVAYLVMEYLDGCTLGEILEEEKNLPVGWTLDILDQVCSAVQEAHEQGIIHRDLKPDNIWLEPNQRGGYTVKVLDFGIAKLETPPAMNSGDFRYSSEPSTSGRQTLVDASNLATIHDSISPTLVSEGATIAGAVENNTVAGDRQTVAQGGGNGSEEKTAILAPNDPDPQDGISTRLMSEPVATENANPNSTEKSFGGETPTKDLTRVGAVLGTPLYMSPEQCRGQKLDARSDVYSLGIIAYQMLEGSTPFSGEFTRVMESHKLLPPPPLKAKNVRKKLKRVIMSALAKNPDDRPQTAEAFATILRSRSEGIFGLLRRAGMIYTEHVTKFLALSAFFHLPMIVLTIGLIVVSFLKVSEAVEPGIANVGLGILAASSSVITAFCAYLIIGTITWIVAQHMAVPLRPIKIRLSLKEARKRWKAFLGTGILSTVLSLVFGVVTCGIGFLVTSVLWALVAPVVMMENNKGWPALKRSKELAKRSLATVTAAVAIMFLIPAVSAGIISFMANISAKAFRAESSKVELIDKAIHGETADVAEPPAAPEPEKERTVDFSISTNRGIRITDTEKDFRSRLTDTILETLLQLLLLPLQIVVTSFTAIIVALLYLKTRLAGGESLQDLLLKFEETDRPRTKWQERVRQRLIQSGRISTTSKS
jgi:serine/threonine protein kinase